MGPASSMLIGSDECPGQGGGLGAPCPQHWLHPALWLLSLASRGAFWLNSVLCWKKVHAAINSQAAQSTYICKKRVVFLHNPATAGKTSAPKLLPYPPSLSPGCSRCCSGSVLPCGMPSPSVASLLPLPFCLSHFILFSLSMVFLLCFSYCPLFPRDPCLIQNVTIKQRT